MIYLIKIEELFEELSLAPSQQLEELVNRLISNGTNGLPCNISLTIQDKENVGIACVSSTKHIIWHISTQTNNAYGFLFFSFFCLFVMIYLLTDLNPF